MIDTSTKAVTDSHELKQYLIDHYGGHLGSKERTNKNKKYY